MLAPILVRVPSCAPSPTRPRLLPDKKILRGKCVFAEFSPSPLTHFGSTIPNMNRDKWITKWRWLGMYLEMLLPCAPRKADAARAADISDEHLVTIEKETGVFYSKPIRKFFRLKGMPNIMVHILEEFKRWKATHSSTPRRPGCHPRPPSLRHRAVPNPERSDGKSQERGAPE